MFIIIITRVRLDKNILSENKRLFSYQKVFSEFDGDWQTGSRVIFLKRRGIENKG